MDMYLRILKAIDEEVVDRDVIRSQQVNFVNCFKNCNATISIGEYISPTNNIKSLLKFVIQVVFVVTKSTMPPT